MLPSNLSIRLQHLLVPAREGGIEKLPTIDVTRKQHRRGIHLARALRQQNRKENRNRYRKNSIQGIRNSQLFQAESFFLFFLFFSSPPPEQMDACEDDTIGID
jgi:diphthamide biosynthesis protein 4